MVSFVIATDYKLYTNTKLLVTGYDCGIFTFLFMALHSQGVPLKFNQDDIYNCWGGKGMRLKLAYMLWKNSEV